MKSSLQKNLYGYIICIIVGIFIPLVYPSFVVQFAFAWLFIVMALTWDLQGGQMGYNSFGNIVFFGIGMYTCVVLQIIPFFSLAEWSEGGGEKTFTHTNAQYFRGLLLGILASGFAASLIAAVLGSLILRMRGHYFAICTLALGVAVGEMVSGIEILGGGSGISVPVWPEAAGSIDNRNLLFYYLALGLFALCFLILQLLLRTTFGGTLNAIRDDEDKAEAMGIAVVKYKILGWVISAFFLGFAGAITGNMVGFIDPIDVAFAGATYGVWMILMVIMGGKGTLWGPVIGALIFHVFQELFWTYLLGWQRVALGALIVIIVVFFPKGILGYFQTRSQVKNLSRST
ncbi:branched-chain amino acid transport system permease [Spirochaetota bacterium]|nr:branched-chain amino acid transport system permease [Spirochaetota bacterium]